MRKVRTGRCEYDYVEVMACPSGEWARGGGAGAFFPGLPLG